MRLLKWLFDFAGCAIFAWGLKLLLDAIPGAWWMLVGLLCGVAAWLFDSAYKSRLLRRKCRLLRRKYECDRGHY